MSMMIYVISFIVGGGMGTLHGYLMHSALFSGRSFFVSNIARYFAIGIALFILKQSLDLDFISWSFGFFPSLWYYALTKLREKPDEIRNI